MQKYAFRMQLQPGSEAKYRRRHDAIWPELVELLRDAGVQDYSIHLDPGTSILWRRDDHTMDDLRSHPVMQRWWAHMADIMQCHASNEPVATPLITLFHLP